MTRFKRAYLTLSFAILCLVSLSTPAVDIGDVAPDWSLKNGAGQVIDYYGSSRGNISVLIYWATWCPYCASLMPHLQELADQYQGEGVSFYAMNIIEDGDPVQHLQDNGYTFELVLDADVTMDAYGVRGTPMVFVVDREHRVVYRRIPDTPDADVKTAVKDALTSLLN